MHAPSLKTAVLSVAIAVCFLAQAAPAVAMPGDGKVILGKFATAQGSGAGQTKAPRGVAVNQTGAGAAEAGDVYLADTENNRVDVFSAAGSFKSAFGLQVDETSGGDICTAASGDTCKAGVSSGVAGSLAAPAGIAIDQVTGTVYVTSEANNRVDVFSADGEFEGAFGWKVNAGAPAEELQFCTALTTCQAGTASAVAGGMVLNPKVNTSSLLAVGPEGDVYIPDLGNVRIDQVHPVFNASEEVTSAMFVRAIGWKVAVSAPVEGIQECTFATGCQKGTAGAASGQFSKEGPSSVGVAGNGSIYAVNRATATCSAAEPCKVVKINAAATSAEDFAPATLKVTAGSIGAGAPFAVAVDPASQDLFVAKKAATTEYRLLELAPSGALLATSPAAGGLTSAPAFTKYGLAVGTEERVYLSTQPSTGGGGGQVYLLGSAPPPTAEFGGATDVGAKEATFTGTVTPPDELEGARFDTHWRFEYSTDQDEWTKAPVPDRDAGSVPGTAVPVETTVTGLEPSKRYFVRLCATTGPIVCDPERSAPPVTFTTLGAAPEVLETYGAEITQTAAILGARVNPENSATAYFFEWGSTTSYGHRTPAFERQLGGGGEPVTAAEEIDELLAGTNYHYRVVATNAIGTTRGPDHHFTTLNVNDLPNDRGLELVSPMPIGQQGVVNRLLPSQTMYQAADDGQSIVFPVLNGTEDTTAGGEVRYESTRSAGGWDSEQLSPPSLVQRGEGGAAQGQTSYVHWVSNELTCSILESVNPLTADVPAVDREIGVTNLYSRDAAGHYTLISNTIPANPTLRGNGKPYFVVAGASGDCSRIYFSSGYELLPGASGVYEWHDGIVRDAGLLPDGTPATVAGTIAMGGEGATGAGTRANSVSGDASRFFFTATSDAGSDQGKRAVFAREAGASIDISQSRTATATLGARYETASPDGSRVFFVANYGLAANGSSSGPVENCANGRQADGACDLYEYDLESGSLTDLSVDENPLDTARGAVVEGVVATSETGDVVYFVALGQLVPGRGNTYAQNLEGDGSANLYVIHGSARTLTYVATVAREDLGSSGETGGTSVDQGTRGLLMNRPGSWDAQVTPDGQHLVFVSERPLTGYRSDGVPEAFLYSLAEERTVCLSCRRDGRASVAIAQSTPIPGTPAQVATQLYFPRVISNDGSRVFFTIADPLTPDAISGAKNLYMWEDGSVYLINTETKGIPPGELGFGNVFYAASASGNDVFFVSINRLVPQDKDDVQSLYDARVGGGFPSEPESTVPCDPLAEGTCQGAGAPAAPPSVPLTPSFTGPGNSAPAPSKHKKKGPKHKKKGRPSKHKKKGHKKKSGDHKRKQAADRRHR